MGHTRYKYFFMLDASYKNCWKLYFPFGRQIYVNHVQLFLEDSVLMNNRMIVLMKVFEEDLMTWHQAINGYEDHCCSTTPYRRTDRTWSWSCSKTAINREWIFRLSTRFNEFVPVDVKLSSCWRLFCLTDRIRLILKSRHLFKLQFTHEFFIRSLTNLTVVILLVRFW